MMAITKNLSHVAGQDYLTVSKAARTIGVAEQTIRNLLTQGKLIRYKFKGLTLLKKDELLAYHNRATS